MADPTRLELATSAVTGRRSNQLSYESLWGYYTSGWGIMQGLQAKIVGFWDCDARLALIGFGGARVVIMGDVWYNVEKDAVVAQLAEQLIRNEQVAGSIPVNGSIVKSARTFRVLINN